MLTKTNVFFSNAKKCICRNILIVVLFLFPRRLSFVFISLNILAIVYKSRNIDFKMENVRAKYISKLLNTAIYQEVLLLPEYTINWIWDEKFLNELIEINGKKYRIYDVISNKDVFNHNIKQVIDIFVQKLPLLFKIKFNLNLPLDKNNNYYYLTFKNKLIKFLVYA